MGIQNIPTKIGEAIYKTLVTINDTLPDKNLALKLVKSFGEFDILKL